MMMMTRIIAALGAAFTAASGTASAQQWQDMPRMELERQFAGPLRDTIIQRLRDPGDGTVCYIYLPITAPHTVPGDSGFVQYGPNGIGTISCLPPAAAAPAPQAQ